MSNNFIDRPVLINSKYGVNDIPENSHVYISYDYATKDDYSSVAKILRTNDGVLHFQDIKFYDNEGNEICP